MPRSKPSRDGGKGPPEDMELKRGKKKRGGPGGGAAPPGAYASMPDDDFSGDDDLDCLGVPMDSVVKVWCVHSKPNFSLPWQRRRQVRSSGSGFCINRDRRAILTNAHCIEHHAQVKVQRRGQDTKYLAKVVSVGWECDCAILTVEDDEFWEGIQVVELCAKVPRLEEAVLCVGFPVGGDTISVTSGVISRIEVMTYAQTATELLGIQIDAAINDGNSGGPAFNEQGECLGMAFQSLSAEKAENIGYVIPTVVITHFLSDLLKHSKYTGFPTLGIDVQTMENAHLREAFGMEPKQKGLLISRVAPTSAAASVLKANDVLLAFDGEQIANDGTVRFRKHERVAFTWNVAQKFHHDSASLTVLRDGKVEEVKIKDFHPEAPLVSVHLFSQPGGAPSYYIIAGLVFTTLSVPFLRSEFGEEWDCEAPVELVHSVMYRRAEHRDEQLVVLTQLLAHDLTVGYEDLENVLLHTVNGTKVRNLRSVMELCDACETEYLHFGLQPNLELVLKTKAAKDATAEVLVHHTIPAAMSADLSGIGSAAPAVEASKDVAAAGDDDEDEEPKVENAKQPKAPKGGKKKK